MQTSTSSTAWLIALTVGVALWVGTSRAPDARSAPPETRGQEVVTGTYACFGTVYTDEQPAEITLWLFLSATSGIADGYPGVSRASNEVPGDLDAMAALCEDRVAHAVSRAPAICGLAPIRRDGGEFGNGASTGASFGFSCQGARDEVMDVIGGLSRLALTDPLG